MDNNDEHQHPTPAAQPARAPLPDAWWDLPLRTRQLIAGGLLAVIVVGAVLLFTRAGDGALSPTVYVATLSSDRVNTWEALAACESETQWDLVSGNGYYGGLQFGLTAWEEFGGVGSPADASREEQIMRAEFLHELQGWKAWPGCSSQLGLE